MDKVIIEKKTVKIDVEAKGNYKDMKLKIDIFKNTDTNGEDEVTIDINDMDDDLEKKGWGQDPWLRWLGNDKFKYNIGHDFWVDIGNRKLEALAKDKEFVEWFKTNVLPIVDNL